jgi:hypothetical protein
VIPAVPVVLAAVAAGSGFLLWRFWNQAPVGVAIQYPLDSKIAYTLTNDQMDAVEQAQKAMIDNGIPPELGAAMLANAYAESKFDRMAVGDVGASVGIWQINVNGGVAPYLSNLADRSDPYKSTVAMIQFMEANKGTKTIPGASPRNNPDLAGADPLTLYDSGVRDIERLTTSFRYHVERPAYSSDGVARREQIARQMFPVRAVI